MKGLGSVLAAGAGLLQAVSALTPITIRGNAFFNGTDRFYVRGVDYQPGKPSMHCGVVERQVARLTNKNRWLFAPR